MEIGTIIFIENYSKTKNIFAQFQKFNTFYKCFLITILKTITLRLRAKLELSEIQNYLIYNQIVFAHLVINYSYLENNEVTIKQEICNYCDTFKLKREYSNSFKTDDIER
jgi:hypothetical protein